MKTATGKAKVIFMGTSDFAVNSLEALTQAGHDIQLVLTQPDRPRGRGRQPAFSPIKEKALELGLAVYQPEKVRDAAVLSTLSALAPDFIIVVSYGQIIAEEILALPRYGCLNVHASLLPRYRGAAPIQRAIMAGEGVSGITIMHMDKTLDTGDIILQQSLYLEDDWDHGEVEERLARMGAALLLDAMQELMQGDAPRVRQQHESSTYAPRILREDERIDWQRDAADIFNQIRALSPRPGAYSILAGESVKVFKAAAASAADSGLPPGSITAFTAEGFLVQAGCGQLEILSVQRAGKKRMGAKNFADGQRLSVGQRFESG